MPNAGLQSRHLLFGDWFGDCHECNVIAVRHPPEPAEEGKCAEPLLAACRHGAGGDIQCNRRAVSDVGVAYIGKKTPGEIGLQAVRDPAPGVAVVDNNTSAFGGDRKPDLIVHLVHQQREPELEFSLRCGCRPNAFQIRRMVVCDSHVAADA